MKLEIQPTSSAYIARSSYVVLSSPNATEEGLFAFLFPFHIADTPKRLATAL
jgi:hypothetical protein